MVDTDNTSASASTHRWPTGVGIFFALISPKTGDPAYETIPEARYHRLDGNVLRFFDSASRCVRIINWDKVIIINHLGTIGPGGILNANH